MLRSALFAAAVVALVAPARAADPDLSGNWLLSYSSRAGSEQNFVILKVETKDGKTTASAIFPPTMTVSGFEVKDKAIRFNTSAGASFEGAVGAGDELLGSFGNEQIMFRAKLAKTDKTELAANERVTTTKAPTQVAESQKLMSAATLARGAATREKDAEKKKELVEKAEAAEKEANEKAPVLLREVVGQSAGTPFAIDAAVALLQNGAKFKITADEAKSFLAVIEKGAAAYGTRYAQTAAIQAVEALASQKGLEAVAVGAAEKLTKALPADSPAAVEVRVLAAYKMALEKSSVPEKDAALKTVVASLAKIEGKLDAEYLAKVPPFKPTAFAGRKEKGANQVVVMELFTGAQCPPCVAADVAFDALQKAYKPTELALIQYHMHIPGPDPLTNPDAIARWDYYRKEFPDNIRGTPSTLFNGKPQAGGGGGMANAEKKFNDYSAIINPLLENTTEVKIAGKATRNGNKIDIGAEVTGAAGDDLKLRFVLVEENVKYTGGNGLRFHHQVVRAMPGGADGVAVKDKTFKHTATADVTDVRKALTKYLDDFAADRLFPKPDRPMDMKALRVIALVQNDKTREILQAIQIDVEGQAPAGGQ